MAAIASTFPNVGPFTILRSAATSAQTDWIARPAFASLAIVRLSITAAGTNTTLTILSADPVLRDDAQALTLFAGATITAASNHEYLIGPWPKVAEIADGAAADAVVLQDELVALPALMGLQIALTGSTYTLSVEFRK